MQPGVLSVMHVVADRGAKTLAASALLAALFACSDARTPMVAPLFAPAASHPLTSVAHLRGTLDVATGTLTFDPVSASGTPVAGGPSAAIYGDQGVNVRIYNSAVVTGASLAGKKTYTANVGVRNLLGFRIGDEQNAAAPADTLGIYVFVNTAPVVSGTSSPCSCTVTVKNADGVLNFNAPNQQYWFWSDVLGAAASARDSTLVRKTWVFEADTQVTRFNFDVLVSAPWAAPHDTRYKVDYQGDSLPDTQSEPKWQLLTSGTTSATAAAGALTLSVRSGQRGYYRRDSVATNGNAYIEGTMKWNAVPGAGDQLRIGLDDGVKVIAVGVFSNNVSFVDANGVRIGTAVAAVTTAYHRYQLRKYAADSAVFYIDDVRGQKLAYTSFPADPYAGTSPLILFGEAEVAGVAFASSVDYVTYELGVVTP
jgi:hypothetical protein